MARPRKPGRPKKIPDETGGQAASLANLQQNQDGKVNRERDQHGVYLITMEQPKTRDLAKYIMEQLQADGVSWLKNSDAVTVQLLALCLRRLNQADAFLDKKGSLMNPKGELLPLCDFMVKLVKEAQALADKLGLNPQARVKLGIDTIKAFNLAELLAETEGSEPDEADRSLAEE